MAGKQSQSVHTRLLKNLFGPWSSISAERDDEVIIVVFEVPALPRGRQDGHGALFTWFAETPIG